MLVELVDGPCDGLRESLATAAELDGPRENLGALMVVDGWAAERALYEPDPPPAAANVWRYRGPVRA
ncbi:hypothetical protein ACSNOI_03335 [Actinomadura kijaniata]|uniref:hypothetical protein n=1 Tax=Actinomadura kijaniata TaxID=46161 RepID=UPI003F1AB3AF